MSLVYLLHFGKNSRLTMTKTVRYDKELSVLQRNYFILTGFIHAIYHTPIQNCTHINFMYNTLCTGDVTLRSTRKVFYLQYPVHSLK